jgi:hypothetical protein
MSYGTSEQFQSKKAMQDALNSEFKFVCNDTSFINNKGRLDPYALTEGASIGPVVGPDVYRNRKWYATITRKNGRLIVK